MRCTCKQSRVTNIFVGRTSSFVGKINARKRADLIPRGGANSSVSVDSPGRFVPRRRKVWQFIRLFHRQSGYLFISICRMVTKKLRSFLLQRHKIRNASDPARYYRPYMSKTKLLTAFLCFVLKNLFSNCLSVENSCCQLADLHKNIAGI